MPNNPGGIRWEDGSPAYNEQVKKMGVAYSHISPEEAKSNSLEYVRLKHNQQWDSEEDIPYADSIYKMIDNVIEAQLDCMADMELEDFYRYHMQKHYEDKRNAVEFNDAWMAYKEGRDG